MHIGAVRWRQNIALLLLLVRMRAHVVIVFGCWDDWGVWEDSSSIYLYSLSVHHARIVQQRGCQLLTGWRCRAELGRRRRAAVLQHSAVASRPAGSSGRLSSPAASALAVVAAAVTATILRFLLNLEAARPFHSEICHHYTTTTSID